MCFILVRMVAITRTARCGGFAITVSKCYTMLY